MHEFDRYLDAGKFLGPFGGWGHHKAIDPDRVALHDSQWYFARQEDTQAVRTMLTSEIPSGSVVVESVLRRCHQVASEDAWNVCTFIPVGKVVRSRSSGDAAFPWREARHSVEFTVGGATNRTRHSWADGVYEQLLPYKLGTYVNYPDTKLQEYASDYWGTNYPRLQELKWHYDPTSVFDSPQGITPKCTDCFVMV